MVKSRDIEKVVLESFNDKNIDNNKLDTVFRMIGTVLHQHTDRLKFIYEKLKEFEAKLGKEDKK